MIGDESKKDEDLLLYVGQRLNEITKKFKKIFKDFDAKDEEHKSLAVYISCYYHHKNSELQD
jgi:hypothetical protein